VEARLVEGDVGQGGSRARRGGRIATEGEDPFLRRVTVGFGSR
jgi:hypothetical protein